MNLRAMRPAPNLAAAGSSGGKAGRRIFRYSRRCRAISSEDRSEGRQSTKRKSWDLNDSLRIDQPMSAWSIFSTGEAKPLTPLAPAKMARPMRWIRSSSSGAHMINQRMGFHPCPPGDISIDSRLGDVSERGRGTGWRRIEDEGAPGVGTQLGAGGFRGRPEEIGRGVEIAD